MKEIKRFKDFILFESEWINKEKYEVNEYVLVKNDTGNSYFAKIKSLFNHPSLGSQEYFKVKVENEENNYIDIKSTNIIRHLSQEEINTFIKNQKINRHQ